MKVKALSDGVHKYYRAAGDVFDWDEEIPLPVAPYKWVEKVSEDTPNKMQEVGEKGVAFECPECGYITQRRTRFCPDCGYSTESAKEEEQREKDRADAIEAIQGKQARPAPGKKRKMGTSTSQIVDKDQQV